MSPAVTPADNSNRLPSLDGVRAFCITLVAFAHLMGTSGFPKVPSPYLSFWVSLTEISVRTFFVLSGFLITTILLVEQRRTGRISLAVFYFRRALRIFPGLYAYVLVIAIAQHLGWIQLKRWDLLAMLTFTTNYHHDRSWYTGHTWSLGIEEQFYLLWPFALKVLSETKLRRLTWLVIVVAPLIRVALYRLTPSLQVGIGETFPTVADNLAVGCLLALSRKQLGDNPRYIAFLRSRFFWCIPLTVLAIAAEPSDGARFLIGETIMNFGIAVAIDRFTRFAELPSGRLLNWRPFVTLGVMSYSLFLWQQLFLDRRSHTVATTFPLNLGLALVVGYLSYHLIDRPFGQLRRRWEREWSLRRTQGNQRGPTPSVAA